MSVEPSVAITVKKKPIVSLACTPRAPVFPALPEPGSAAVQETPWAGLRPDSSPCLSYIGEGQQGMAAHGHRVSFSHEASFLTHLLRSLEYGQ